MNLLNSGACSTTLSFSHLSCISTVEIMNEKSKVWPRECEYNQHSDMGKVKSAGVFFQRKGDINVSLHPHNAI